MRRVVETVKIISKNKDGYIVINKSDFDSEVHQLFVEKKVDVPVPKSNKKGVK